MPQTPTSVLLDINVWLDNYLPDRPSSNEARVLLTWLRERGVSILYPITAPGTVFYVVQHSMKRAALADGVALSQANVIAIRELAWACVENMAELGVPVGADVSDFWRARKYRSIHADLEDNLVLAAADRSQAGYLITSDESLLKKSGIPALTAHDFLRTIC